MKNKTISLILILISLNTYAKLECQLVPNVIGDGSGTVNVIGDGSGTVNVIGDGSGTIDSNFRLIQVCQDT